MIKITFSFLPSFEKNPKYTNYLEIGVYKNEKCLYLLTDDGQMIRYYFEDVKKIEKQVKDLTLEEMIKLGFYKSEYTPNIKNYVVFELNKTTHLQHNLTDYIDITKIIKGE